MIGTFAIVLVFTMIKEAYEDIQRYKSDKELNNRKTAIYNYHTGNFEDQQWQKLKIGDIVKVVKDKEFPADLLLIASTKDVVFVDTMNLDGETNLKEKFTFLKDFGTD